MMMNDDYLTEHGVLLYVLSFLWDPSFMLIFFWMGRGGGACGVCGVGRPMRF